MCLAQGHNAVRPVRFEPMAPRSGVKHSTTEPLCSYGTACVVEKHNKVCLGLFLWPILFQSCPNFVFHHMVPVLNFLDRALAL